MHASTSRPPPLWPFLLACAAAAVWIDFGTLHRGQHADSLLTTLISLYRWTPYYWDLDRGGALVSLLAAPFRHPLANVLFQGAANVFCTLAAVLLLARYVLRDASYPAVGLLLAAAFVALPTTYYRSEIFLNSGYGVWLTLGLAALLLLEAPPEGRVSWGRRAAALALMVTTHWVWCTAALFLGPLVLFRGLFRPAPRGDPFPADPLLRRARAWLHTETAAGLLLLAVGCAAGFAIRGLLAPHVGTAFGSLPPGEWLPTLRGVAWNTWFYLNPRHVVLVLWAAGGAGVLSLAVPAVRRRAPNAVRAAAGLTTAAVLLALFMATREHVKINACAFRYLAQSTLYLTAALASFTIGPLCLAVGGATRKGAYALATALLAFAAVHAYGFPSPAGVRADLAVPRAPVPAPDGLLGTFQPCVGMRADDILAAGCTHVAGDYWKVWPAVFEANLALCDRGERRVVWGVTLRSGPTQRYWGRVPLDAIRVAVPAGGDPVADAYFKEYGFPPLVVVEKWATIWVLRPEKGGKWRPDR